MVPIGVATVTFLAVCAVPAVIAQLALTVVEVDVIPVQVTPPPETVTAVAPVRLAPVRVTGTVVPWAPVIGLIEASVGPCTVIEMELLAPAGFLTVTVCVPSAAVVPVATANVAVSIVGLVTLTALTVIPPARFTATLIPVVVKLVPVRVTEVVVVPRTNVLGATEPSVGSGGLTAVNVTALLAPPVVVVTLTLLALIVAVAEIVNVAVIVVEFTTAIVPTVTPVPDTVTVVPIAVKLAPVRVTETLVPRRPLLGAIEASVGAAGLTTVSIAVVERP